MRNLIAVPVILIAVIIQMSVISNLPLLGGYGDLPLVMLAAWALQQEVDTAWHWAVAVGIFVGFISGVNWLVFVIGYLTVVFFAKVLQIRVWQAPLLAMFSVTFLGSVFVNLLTYLSLRLAGLSISLLDAFGLLLLPSVLINMLIAIPVYAVMRDLARWVYPVLEAE